MTLRSLAISAYLSPTARALRRAVGSRSLWYVHQPDDPYSLLVAQVLPDLVDSTGLPLRLSVLRTPPDAFTPDAPRLRAWALSDAARLARRFGLRFPDSPVLPAPAATHRAQVHALRADTPAALADISFALFSGETLPERKFPRDALAASEAAVHRAGQYQGAMVRYRGEWFWGLDRLPYLIDSLRGDGLEAADRLPSPPAVARAPSGAVLEFFCSFRSPYTYLAAERAIALASERGVTLRLRPVLPMVMRGLSVPLSKRLYIVRDCKRIAARHGLPFGRIADPLGVGVERCIAVSVAAEREGRAAAWLAAAGRGIWGEGVDVSTDAGLLKLAARAGLSAERVHDALADDGWRAVAEDNRAALLGMGLWGVPSFRLGELVVWGQDRLDVLRSALG